MKTITLAKALSLKNTIVGEMKDLSNKLVSNKLYKEGKLTEGQAKVRDEFYPTYIRLSDNLMKLKSLIRLGNVRITEELVKLEELKSLLVVTKSMVAEESWTHDYGSDDDVHFFPLYDQKLIEQNIKIITNQIEELQDHITAYNHVTQIEVDFL